MMNVLQKTILHMSILLLASCELNGKKLNTRDTDSFNKSMGSASNTISSIPDNPDFQCQYEYTALRSLEPVTGKQENIYEFRAGIKIYSIDNISVTQTISLEKSPFSSDERNLSDIYLNGWVIDLIVKVNGKDIFIPITAYSEMEYSPSIQVGEFRKDGSFILLFDHTKLGTVTVLKFSPKACGSEKGHVDEYKLVSSERWYPPMAPDSCIKTMYKIPLCN